jgi:peptidoglycan/xylan/chitin deacetylase (PgdA/CDA1 family)
VLDVLARLDVKATFFMVGGQVKLHPDIAQRVRDGGHDVGLHSMAHLDHAGVGREAALADVRDGAEAIGDVRLFRAPYGHFVPATLAESERCGWTPVHWSAWGEDWREGESAETIASRVIADLAPGAIVLLHDGRREKHIECERMLGALELVLAEARSRGLEPVTVSELLTGAP